MYYGQVAPGDGVRFRDFAGSVVKIEGVVNLATNLYFLVLDQVNLFTHVGVLGAEGLRHPCQVVEESAHLLQHFVCDKFRIITNDGTMDWVFDSVDSTESFFLQQKIKNTTTREIILSS